jgi:hydroxymethylpyrimidine/phosphomethylpyrimidine kinase
MTVPPRVLVIAGSDSSGGAGIQADIKTITMLGGYAMTAITAVTAQNSLGVSAVEALGAPLVGHQIDACLSDIGADAVKIGMLGSAEIAHLVADRLEGTGLPIVFDPVMVSTSGAVLAGEATTAAFGRLMALATITTPNLPELEALSGMAVGDQEEMTAAAALLVEQHGARAVLAKGGHWPGGSIRRWNGRDVANDLVFDCLYQRSSMGELQQRGFEHARVETRHSHGTGCTLSSAIATELGRGADLGEAVDRARKFVRAALLAAPGFGAGYGPMGHQAVR